MIDTYNETAKKEAASALRVPRADMEEQEAVCLDIRARTGGGVYCVVTYGCQMNAHDSEALAGYLELMGYAEGALEDADVVVFNTCCIRDNAERRVMGNVTALRERKRQNPDMIIAVCGCMTQQEGAAQRLAERLPFVSLVFGTGQGWRLPEMMRAVLDADRPLVYTGDIDTVPGSLPIKRGGGPLAYITVMQGCDNYCSYCIVPYVRGRQRSRSPEDIEREAAALAASGVKELMLLGQNVNSYGQDLGGGCDFAGLLKRLDGVAPRLRFMTSHPKDLGNGLIEAMSKLDSVCPQLHLPVQSGSDAILSAMNRGYTRAAYMERVRRLRDAVPGLGLTTDFIVGFPGETERDFEDTLSLAAEARFDAAYTFIYSPRKGTAAASFPGAVEKAVSRERIERLIAAQEAATAEALKSLVGQRHGVLVEKASKRDARLLMGRIPRGQAVNFAGDASLIGRIVDVNIAAASRNTLKGVL